MASFLDTNILLYFVDDAEPEKQARAKEVVEREVTAGTMLVSTQVLQEFYNTSLGRKAHELQPWDG